MKQIERRKYMIEYLLSENNLCVDIPTEESAQKRMLRALFNVRIPKAASEDFIRIQNEYLQEEIKQKGITDVAKLKPTVSDIYLWKGEITTLKCDAIVNAANSQMLGCFCANHGCIDNAIHTFAGIQLRQECARIMSEQAEEEQTGKAKITEAYNLPCKYILHTVGPIVYGKLTKRHEEQLEDCYLSCLTLVDKYGLKSIAFCCISTGEFNFPQERAAQIAIHTVDKYKKQTQSQVKVIFNVFKEADYDIYAKLLDAYKQA